MLTASDDERAAISEAFDLLELTSFAAELTLKPWRRTGWVLTGVVKADVVQQCVVTLQPVSQTIREPIEIRYLPRPQRRDSPADEAEMDIDPLGEDEPDELDGPDLDVGAVALEQFALALDPYPRAAGVAFSPEEADGDTDDPRDRSTPESPFAALERMKGESPS